MLVVEEAVAIRVLRWQGKSFRAITQLLEISRNTPRRYLRSEGLLHYQRAAVGPVFSRCIRSRKPKCYREMAGTL